MAINPFQNFMVRYGAGERIFTEGDLGTTMYIVQSGQGPPLPHGRRARSASTA